VVCNGKTNRPRFKGHLVPLLKLIEKLNKISIKNWQTVKARYTCDRNHGFSLLKSVQRKAIICRCGGTCLKQKPQSFVIRVRVKEIKISY